MYSFKKALLTSIWDSTKYFEVVKSKRILMGNMIKGFLIVYLLYFGKNLEIPD